MSAFKDIEPKKDKLPIWAWMIIVALVAAGCLVAFVMGIFGALL